jgi:hypothetical protein
MRITVYSGDSAKTATTAASKSTKKNVVGTAVLDMSSFVDTDDSPRMFLLPVKGQGQRSGNDMCGWLILGLQYFQSKSNTAAAANVSSNAVDDKAALTWANILSDPTIVTAGYDSRRYADTTVQKSFTMGMGVGMGVGTAFIQPAASPNPESIALHVAMGQLDLSMSVAADLKAAENEILLVLVRAGMPNELLKQPSTAGKSRSNTVRTLTTWDIETAAAPSDDQSSGLAIAVVNQATGLPEWDAADITVKCATNKVFTPAVYVALYRGRRVSSCQIDAASSTFIGEAVVTLSRAALMHGAPINTVVPLRDQDGIRVAILQLGAQKTSLLPSTGASGMGATATAGVRGAPTLLFDRQSMGNAEDAGSFISLSICIEEGSIIDPFWRQPVEPFFEFTLIPPREDIRMPGSAISRARTGFVSRAAAAGTSSSGTTRTRRNNQQAPSDLRLSKNNLSASARLTMDSSHSPWGLVCNLLLPRAGFPVGPADEMGKPVWAVAVVCRDAARAGCPEIASARVGLPWSLLARGRSTDQWLVLFNSLAHGAGSGQPGTVSLGMDMAMRSIEGQDNLASSGRIRLRITSKSMGTDSRGLQQTTFGRQGPWTGVTALQQFQTQFLGGIDAGPQYALGHTQVRGASHPGIGASLIWLRGLANMRSGQEIEPLNITMASATSLVPPVVSQSVYGDIYHDLADRGDEKERLTFSELVFGRYGNRCKINDDGSRQVCDGWGEDWMAGVPGLDGLCGSLPVAGGHSDLRLGISVAHKKVPYSASFSILSGLTPCAPPDSEHDIRDPSALSCPTSVQIPALDILVSAHDDDDSAPSNGTGRKAFAQELRVVVRSVPRLKLWTAFVPFVRGRLTLCCRSVRFPLQAQQSRRFPDGRAHRCALRFAMSTDSFGYTAAFDIPLDTDTVTTMTVIQRSAPVGGEYGQIQTFEPPGAAQTRGRQQKGSTTMMKPFLPASPGRQRDASSAGTDSGFSVTLPIDTLEFTTRGGSCSMLTLQVTLVDLDESGSLYCIGEGGVQTAPLYYQALRAASASAPPAAGPSSFKAAPAPVGVSPWVTSESTLYDRYKQEPAAWVTLSTQFVMEGLSLPVITALQAARHSVEMAFADEDRPMNTRYSAESANGDSSTCNGSEMEELHVVSGSRAVSPYPESTLVNGKAAGSAEKRARTELGLKQAFLAADTDRSGSVSVEELLAVIKQSGVRVQKPKPQMGRTGQTRGVVGMEDTFALLLGLAGDTMNMTTVKKNDPLSITADPSLEQTVRRIFARLDVDGDGMISWWEWQASLSGALLGRHPSEKYIDPVDGLAVIAQAAEDALSAKVNTTSLSDPESGLPDLWDTPYIDPSGVAKVPMSLWDSGSNTRISQDVSSLRLGGGGGWGSTGMPGDGMYDNTYRDSAVVAAALKRQLEAETAAEEARMAHRSESKKRADLEASLTALKHLNDVVRGAREEKDGAARLLKEKLMADAAGHKDNLDRIVLNKKKRLRASITIALFLKRRVVPYYRRLILERQRSRLGMALLGVFHRRNFLKTMDLRTRATLLLQRKVRGILGRIRLRKLKEAVLKVQVFMFLFLFIV